MDFALTDDQQTLARGMRSLLEGRLSLEYVRQSEGKRRTFDAVRWHELGDAGVFSLMLDEEHGGVGLGVIEAVVVFEELGRALTPGPLVGTTLAAGLVKGAAEGSAAVGVLTESAPAVPIVVEHLGSLDALMVVGQGRAINLLDPAKLESTRIEEPLDPLTPMWRIDTPLPPGELAGDRATGSRIVRDGTLLTAALQIGHGAAVLERAVAYAKDRVQFGRPIGSFQAIKHLCADMLVRVEVARCAVHSAACLCDQPEALAQESEVSGRPADEVLQHAMWGAKLLADEAAIGNCRAAIQVHGGMGFTWEEPLHLYLKRSLVAASTFGRATRLAQALGSQL